MRVLLVGEPTAHPGDLRRLGAPEPTPVHDLATRLEAVAEELASDRLASDRNEPHAVVVAGWPMEDEELEAVHRALSHHPSVGLLISLAPDACARDWAEASEGFPSVLVSASAGTAELHHRTASAVDAYRRDLGVAEARADLDLTRARIESIAMVDTETGLYNRRYMLARLRESLSSARRYGRPLSIVLVRLAGLAEALSTLPMQEALALAGQVADVFTVSLRDADVVARIRGEVFAWMLPETGIEGANLAADRLCMSLEPMLAGQGQGLRLMRAVLDSTESSSSAGRLLELAEDRLEG